MYCNFSGKLCSTVDILRSLGSVYPVEFFTVAGENIVGADVHKQRSDTAADSGDDSSCFCIDAPCYVGFVLSLVYSSVGSAVNDHIGSYGSQICFDAFVILQRHILSGGGNIGKPTPFQLLYYVIAELAGGSGD